MVGEKYRRMCGELDQVGIVIYINRITPHKFELHINGTIVKQYRQRRSCNNQILKIYKSKFKSNEKSIKRNQSKRDKSK